MREPEIHRNPCVTVSIVNHGNREATLAALSQLREGSATREIEIVVLDNASEDGSVEAVRNAFPDVRVIPQEFRDGFGANHNRVIRATRSAYVFLLNDDARLDSAGVERLACCLDADAALAAVGPLVRGPSGRVQQTAWHALTPWNVLRYAWLPPSVGWSMSGTGTSREVDRISGCALMLRRSALDEVGLFDEGFFMYAEDADLCRRLRDGGYHLRYLPEVCVEHEGQRSTADRTHAREVEFWRSNHRYWSKHYAPAVAIPTRAALGLGFACLATVAGAVSLGGRQHLRPLAAEFLRSARGASLGFSPPGLRESATAWNARHDEPRRPTESGEA